MCGRFILRTFPQSFARALSVTLAPDHNPAQPPRYNIAPMQPIVVARSIGPGLPTVGDGYQHSLEPMLWGLIPHWAKEPPRSGGWINARAETVFEKPSFRSAAKYRRCLIPADGFYEWRTTPDGKNPYLFERADSQPFCFAGIYDHWTASDGSERHGVAILTTGPNAATEGIHDRSPVILGEDAWIEWTRTPPERVESLRRLLRPAPDDFLTSRMVSRYVNNARHDGPECVLSPE